MQGWLVINSFMAQDKFMRLYELLCDSFKKYNVNLLVKKASDISLEVGASINDKPDFVIFWDKDVYLAERLENSGVRLFNSKRAVELCDNKILMYQAFARKGIKIPRTFIAPKTFEELGYTNDDFLKEVTKNISYPLVIKEAYGSFGEQVYLALNEESAKEIIKKIGHKDFLLQEYIAESKGKDVRINVVGKKAIVSMLRENKNDFRSNISNGGTGSLFEPERSYLELAVKAVEALGLDFAGVDVLFGKNGPIICEVNSNPQFESTLKATGVNLGDVIADYILSKL